MKYLLALLVLSLLLAGCAQSDASPPQGVPVKEISPAPPMPPVGGAPEAPLKEFTVTARQFAFEPSTLTVDKGDHVRLKVTSADVKHGFAIDEYGINQQLTPGQEVTVDFVADKSGEFQFYCSVVCGAGHREMTGKLIVQ